MSFVSKLRGTSEQFLAALFGALRTQWKNNAGAWEARNDADAAFIITRGATPVAANDYTTKAYVDAATGAGANVLVVRFAFTTAATTASATSIPAGSIILRARVKLTTPFSAAATIAVGQTGTPTAFQATTDNNPQGNALDVFEVPQDTTSGALLPVLVTIGGAPAAGAGICEVEYVATPQA
jgi:hypothetical protein